MQSLERLYALAAQLLKAAPNAFRVQMEQHNLDGTKTTYDAVRIMREARDRIDEIDALAMALRLTRDGKDVPNHKLQEAIQAVLHGVAPPNPGRLAPVLASPQAVEDAFHKLALLRNRQLTRNTVHRLQAGGFITGHDGLGVMSVKSPWGGKDGILATNSDQLLVYKPGEGDDGKTLDDYIKAALDA